MTLTLSIGGTAMATIEGSEIFSVLTVVGRRKVGRGYSYTATCDRDGARALYAYCAGNGRMLATEAEADLRSEGRALLAVAERIAQLL